MSSQTDLRTILLQRALEEYGTSPDYPWDDEVNAVLRHGRNRKWYALFMRIPRKRLGLSEGGEADVDVLNLKCDSHLIGSLRGREGFHPAYHMNKEKWISVRLDGSVPEEEIWPLIRLSYELTE